MHSTVVLRLEVDRVVLLQRERIHVATQQHGRARLSRVEIGHDRGEGLAQGDVESKSGQGIGDLLLGFGQVKPEFGIGVDRAAQLDGFCVDVGGGNGDIGTEVDKAHATTLAHELLPRQCGTATRLRSAALRPTLAA